jgi:hypothetical protein
LDGALCIVPRERMIAMLKCHIRGAAKAGVLDI